MKRSALCDSQDCYFPHLLLLPKTQQAACLHGVACIRVSPAPSVRHAPDAGGHAPLHARAAPRCSRWIRGFFHHGPAAVGASGAGDQHRQVRSLVLHTPACQVTAPPAPDQVSPPGNECCPPQRDRPPPSPTTTISRGPRGHMVPAFFMGTAWQEEITFCIIQTLSIGNHRLSWEVHAVGCFLIIPYYRTDI